MPVMKELGSFGAMDQPASASPSASSEMVLELHRCGARWVWPLSVYFAQVSAISSQYWPVHRMPLAAYPVGQKAGSVSSETRDVVEYGCACTKPVINTPAMSNVVYLPFMATSSNGRGGPSALGRQELRPVRPSRWYAHWVERRRIWAAARKMWCPPIGG